MPASRSSLTFGSSKDHHYASFVRVYEWAKSVSPDADFDELEAAFQIWQWASKPSTCGFRSLLRSTGFRALLLKGLNESLPSDDCGPLGCAALAIELGFELQNEVDDLTKEVRSSLILEDRD
jgi:hypothetical protein